MPILKVRDSEGNLLELELSKNSVNKIKKDIHSIQINDSGELVIKYNNGEESNLGTVVGVDGLTPFINVDGNWQIGDTDTGVKAVGTDGKDGEDGAPGVSGVYVGSGDMPEDCNVQIDPDGDVFDIFEALNGYVPTTHKIAGIDLKDDVTVDEMQTALGIGNINTALENIIAIQEALINGNYINGITLVDEETGKKYRLHPLNEKVTLEEVEQ